MVCEDLEPLLQAQLHPGVAAGLPRAALARARDAARAALREVAELDDDDALAASPEAASSDDGGGGGGARRSSGSCT